MRKALADSGESENAIAQATGINQGNLSRFIRGERSLSLENFAKLCFYIGLQLVRRRFDYLTKLKRRMVQRGFVPRYFQAKPLATFEKHIGPPPR